MPTLTVSVIIAAGGAGRRFVAVCAGGADGVRSLKDRAPDPLSHPDPLARLGKIFAPLAGRPVLAHTLERFAAIESVAEIVVAAPAACLAEARRQFGETLHTAGAGPAVRLQSVAGGPHVVAGLLELELGGPQDVDFVVTQEDVFGHGFTRSSYQLSVASYQWAVG